MIRFLNRFLRCWSLCDPKIIKDSPLTVEASSTTRELALAGCRNGTIQNYYHAIYFFWLVYGERMRRYGIDLHDAVKIINLGLDNKIDELIACEHSYVYAFFEDMMHPNTGFIYFPDYRRKDNAC